MPYINEFERLLDGLMRRKGVHIGDGVDDCAGNDEEALFNFRKDVMDLIPSFYKRLGKDDR